MECIFVIVEVGKSFQRHFLGEFQMEAKRQMQDKNQIKKLHFFLKIKRKGRTFCIK